MEASGDLLPVVYAELRKLAKARLSAEKPGQTLQATDLVHEAYLRLLGADCTASWDSQAHYFSAAAEAMRRILVERARRKRTLKRGGGVAQRVDLEEQLLVESTAGNERLLLLDIALERLAQQDAQKAELVKLRYFAGLTSAQAAEVLGIGISTADKYWAHAKAWLKAEVSQIQGESDQTQSP